MTNIIRTFIHTILIMAAMNILYMIVDSAPIPVLINLLNLFSHLYFFTFSIVAACVINSQIILMLFTTLFIGLSVYHYPGGHPLQIVFAIAGGFLTGYAVHALHQENRGAPTNALDDDDMAVRRRRL